MTTLQRILCVEDEPDIQAVARMALELVGGFQVQVCGSGEEALRELQSFAPDLVLLDVMMPRKTGLEVCQEVRAEARLQGVRILMLTAKGRDTDVAKGLALGANAYVTKPFSTRDLVARVRSLLEERP